MSTEKFWIFEPLSNADFCGWSAKKRYEILVDLIDKGMKKKQALVAFEWLLMPDEQYEEYLKKLKEY